MEKMTIEKFPKWLQENPEKAKIISDKILDLITKGAANDNLKIVMAAIFPAIAQKAVTKVKERFKK